MTPHPSNITSVLNATKKGEECQHRDQKRMETRVEMEGRGERGTKTRGSTGSQVGMKLGFSEGRADELADAGRSKLKLMGIGISGDREEESCLCPLSIYLFTFQHRTLNEFFPLHLTQYSVQPPPMAAP